MSIIEKEFCLRYLPYTYIDFIHNNCQFHLVCFDVFLARISIEESIRELLDSDETGFFGRSNFEHTRLLHDFSREFL